MAQYKTIALALIQEHEELYERLRRSRRLHPTMEACAAELKTRHQEWIGQTARAKPGSDPATTAAEALELAIEELRHRLASASEASGAGPPSLDAAMSHIRRHTPPA
jgi:hypothetical protein